MTQLGRTRCTAQLPRPHGPNRYGCLLSDAGRDSTQELDRLDMQERAIAMCEPKALPRCVARNSTLNLHAGAADNRDLDDHPRRWLAGSDYSQRYFRSFGILRNGLQQMTNGHAILESANRGTLGPLRLLRGALLLECLGRLALLLPIHDLGATAIAGCL